MSFLAGCFLTRLLTVFRKMTMNYSPSKKPKPESRRKSWNRWETTTCLETRVTSLAIFRANPRDLKRKSLHPLHPKTTYSLRVRLLEVCNSFCYGKVSIYYWFMKFFPRVRANEEIRGRVIPPILWWDRLLYRVIWERSRLPCSWKNRQ